MQPIEKIGSAGWDRTNDRPINSQRLYKSNQNLIKNSPVKPTTRVQWVTAKVSNLLVMIFVLFLSSCSWGDLCLTARNDRDCAVVDLI